MRVRIESAAFALSSIFWRCSSCLFAASSRMSEYSRSSFKHALRTVISPWIAACCSLIRRTSSSRPCMNAADASLPSRLYSDSSDSIFSSCSAHATPICFNAERMDSAVALNARSIFSPPSTVASVKPITRRKVSSVAASSCELSNNALNDNAPLSTSAITSCYLYNSKYFHYSHWSIVRSERPRPCLHRIPARQPSSFAPLTRQCHSISSRKSNRNVHILHPGDRMDFLDPVFLYPNRHCRSVG